MKACSIQEKLSVSGKQCWPPWATAGRLLLLHGGECGIDDEGDDGTVDSFDEAWLNSGLYSSYTIFKER